MYNNPVKVTFFPQTRNGDQKASIRDLMHRTRSTDFVLGAGLWFDFVSVFPPFWSVLRPLGRKNYGGLSSIGTCGVRILDTHSALGI
jgi:hypothetical protein